MERNNYKMERNNYEQMTVSSLKNLPRERGKTRYSRLNKSELIKKLREPTSPREPTREELREWFKRLKVRGYSKLNKAELMKQLENPRPLEYTTALLRQQARERGIRGYYNLSKNELLQRLRTPGEQILDQDIDARMANVPFLTPTSYVPPQATPTPSPSNAVEDLIDYLNNVKEIPKSVSPKLKKLREKIDSIYTRLNSLKVVESDSALKEFAKVYSIDSIEGYDTQSFLQDARQNITSVLMNNRRTKVKMVLRCNMERMGNSEMVIQSFAFHSGIEVNLDGTDQEDLYDTMVEKITENIAMFQSKGSGWRLNSIIRLELYTVRYKPLKGKIYIPLPEDLVY